MSGGIFDLAVRVAGILDSLGIPYALGGSLASSIVGEPRATADADIAVSVPPALDERLLERLLVEFYVPVDSARHALRAHSSFNLLESDGSLKVDLFSLGDGFLDRMQIERRVLVDLDDGGASLWVTSIEDQVLRKLDWFRAGGGVSDRQWRDVVGIIRLNHGALDVSYLRTGAAETDLEDLLEHALTDGAPARPED